MAIDNQGLMVLEYLRMALPELGTPPEVKGFLSDELHESDDRSRERWIRNMMHECVSVEQEVERLVETLLDEIFSRMSEDEIREIETNECIRILKHGKARSKGPIR